MKKQNDNLKASNPPEEKSKSDIIKRREALKRIATTALAFTGAAFIKGCSSPYSASGTDGDDGHDGYSSYSSYASYASYSSYNSYASYSSYGNYSSYSRYTAYYNYSNYYGNYYSVSW